jgi:predicted lipoprotein with Yx(FWY)xxD motif
MRLRTTTALASLAIAAVIAAGCGGSSGSKNASATTGSSGSSGSATSAGGAYGGGSTSSHKPASTPSSGAATVKTASGSLGTFLVDSKGRTLYLWEADKGSRSTCNGACAAAWPPLTTTGHPKASGSAKASLLGTSKRADGSTEVTYAGHPLYYYVGDQKPGDTTGQGSNGFGAPWYVLNPRGSKIDKD